MDDLSQALTRAISSLLEPYEKRLLNIQENHDKVVESLKAKIDSLGIECAKLNEENAKLKLDLTHLSEDNVKLKQETTEERARIESKLTEENYKIKREVAEEYNKIKLDLNEENAKIRLELNDSKSRQDKHKKDITSLISTTSKLLKDIDVCKGWGNYAARMHEEVKNLAEVQVAMEKKMEDFHRSLSWLDQQTARQNSHQFSLHRRPTHMVKSPSTSLILNGVSNHNSRYKTSTLNFLDREEERELEDIDGQVEHVSRQIDDMRNDFEKNSLCSDDSTRIYSCM